jgi:predicted peroxiredoxin
MLPGNATETVYLRPPEATGAALGLDVSIFVSPLSAACFRYKSVEKKKSVPSSQLYPCFEDFLIVGSTKGSAEP